MYVFSRIGPQEIFSDFRLYRLTVGFGGIKRPKSLFELITGAAFCYILFQERLTFPGKLAIMEEAHFAP